MSKFETAIAFAIVCLYVAFLIVRRLLLLPGCYILAIIVILAEIRKFGVRGCVALGDRNIHRISDREMAAIVYPLSLAFYYVLYRIML